MWQWRQSVFCQLSPCGLWVACGSICLWSHRDCKLKLHIMLQNQCRGSPQRDLCGHPSVSIQEGKRSQAPSSKHKVSVSTWCGNICSPLSTLHLHYSVPWKGSLITRTFRYCSGLKWVTSPEGRRQGLNPHMAPQANPEASENRWLLRTHHNERLSLCQPLSQG